MQLSGCCFFPLKGKEHIEIWSKSDSFDIAKIETISKDREAEEMFSRLVKQMAEAESVTEKLKANDMMTWVGKMNGIRNRAAEIVNAELIFA